MSDRAARNDWVEIERVVLPAGERAPQVPEDTQGVALELRVKGFLVAPGAIGDDVEIVTAAGRRLRGRLRSVDPAHTHGFGSPEPTLLPVAAELRARLSASEPER